MHISFVIKVLKCPNLGVLLCVEQSVVEMCSVDPEANLESSARPKSLSQSLSEPQQKTLPEPVKLDPLSPEITPNSLCSLTGQFLPFHWVMWFPRYSPHLKWFLQNMTDVFLLGGRKPLVFSFISLQLSKKPWCGFKAQLSAVCFSVSSGCHCLGLGHMKLCWMRINSLVILQWN